MLLRAFQWVISGSVALLVLFVCLVLARSWQIRITERKQRAISRTWVTRFSPYLAILPVPTPLAKRWAGHDLQVKLSHAGTSWNEREYVAFRWGCMWFGLGLAYLLGYLNKWNLLSQFLMLLIFSSAYLGPPLWLTWQRQRRCESIDLTLPNFMDRLILTMEAGLGFEIALRRITDSFPGLLGDELRKLVRAIDRGHSRYEALDILVTRTPSNDLAAFVTAVKQSDRLGTSLASTLRIQSQLLRGRRRRRAEEAGRRLPLLIVFPLVFLFLPALLIIYLAPPLLHLFLGR